MRKRLLIAAVLAILLAPIAFVGMLLYTETGVRWIDGQLHRLERFGVHIDDVSGTLAGPLRVGRFELNHPRVHVVSHDIVIDLQLRGLLLQTLRAGSVHARDSLVEIRAADLPQTDRPPRFLPRWLRVDARGVELQRVRYVHLNGAVVDAREVSGRVTITSNRLRVRGFNVHAEQFDARGDLRLRARRPLELRAAVHGRLRLPRTELVLKAQADGDVERLHLQAELLEPEQLRAAALFTRLEDAWRLAGEVDAAAFSLEPFLEKPPFSLRDVDLQFAADAEGVHAVGAATAPEFAERPFEVDARGRYAARVLHLAAVELALKETPARLHGSGTVDFEGEAPTLDLDLRWRDAQWPLTGEALVVSTRGEGELRGSSPYEFMVDAQVSGPNLPPGEGVAAGVLAKDGLTVHSYKIDALEGTISGAGSLQWSAPRAWKLAATAQNVNPGVLQAEFPGRLSFSAVGEGAGFDKRASFKLNVGALSGELRGEAVRGSGRLERRGKQWFARKVDVQYGDARLTLSGQMSDTIDARWSLRAPSLAELLPEAAGSIEFSGVASGERDTPHVVAQLTGEKLEYQNWRAGRVRLDADIDAANENSSRLAVSAEAVGVAGTRLDKLRVDATGLAQEHRIRVDLTSASETPGAAPMRATLQAQGALADQQWSGRIVSGQLRRGAQATQKLELVEPAALTVSRARALLEPLCFAVAVGRICAEGQWRDGGAWEGALSGYEIPLALVLPPSGPEAEYAGRVEGRVRVHGAPNQPWQGEAGMRIIDAAVIYRPAGAEPQRLDLGTGGLAATANAERISFSFGVQAFQDTFIYANANILREAHGELLRMPLTGDMRLRAADANILPLLFPEIDHAAGLVTANLDIAGSLAAPELNGRIELARGELDSYRINLALREAALTADLSTSRLDFRGSARAGEGDVNVDGSFTWREGRTYGDLSLRGEDLLVADLPEYRVVASPDLRFRIAGDRIDVAGDVKIPSASIQPNQLTGAVRASSDARYVGEHPAERDGRFTVHSEVRISMGDDVRIDAFGLSGRITGAVGTTVHTGETPVGRGELAVADGRYAAYGQKLDIARGRLLFEGGTLEDPGLDVEARREIDAVTVGLNVRGTLQAPRLTFFSDPAMPQTQIATYLLTGKSVDSIGNSSDVASVGAASETLALQGGGLIASQLGRRLGIEEVGVERSVDAGGEANTSLVLGKFLSPRLFISYGISLTESINTLKLRYTMTDRWIFRTESGEYQSADVEFTFER